MITPSQWLKNLVGSSFLREYETEVRYNTADVQVFKPTPGNFRERYGLVNRRILLGVANVWESRKGLEVFVRLSQMLDPDSVIVLVGLKRKQIKKLPKGIIGIERTFDQKELAEIYSASDVYINPSMDETFGMTTLEALCCGTDVIVYKGTACEEVVREFGKGKGFAVEPGAENIYRMVQKIIGKDVKIDK